VSGSQERPERDFIDDVVLNIIARFPWADPQAVELHYRVGAAAAAARAAVQRLLTYMGHERAAGKIGVLRSLYFAPEGMSQHAIGKNMNATSGSVTYLVDALNRDGMVVRSPHPSDRRAAWVELTPKGREAFEAIAPALTNLFVALSQDFSGEERQQLAQLLIRFTRNADRFQPSASSHTST
jgi:DNA-binding MarR family transcriptional regulator